MPKYDVTLSFIIVVEAETKEQAKSEALLMMDAQKHLADAEIVEIDKDGYSIE